MQVLSIKLQSSMLYQLKLYATLLHKNTTNVLYDISILFDPLVDNFAFKSIMDNVA